MQLLGADQQAGPMNVCVVPLAALDQIEVEILDNGYRYGCGTESKKTVRDDYNDN